MALEASLWKWLKGASKDGGKTLHMNRVENLCMSGMPDVEGATLEGQFWIELKSTTRPKKETTYLRFPTDGRAAQVEFLMKRWDLTCNAWILAQVSSAAGNVRNRRIFLVPGKHAARIYEGVTEWQLQEMNVFNDHQTRSVKPIDVIHAIDRNNL